MEHFGIKYGLCWFSVGPQDVTGHTACADGAGSSGADWSRTDSMPSGAQAYRVGSRYVGIPHRSCCGKISMSFGLKPFLCEDSCCFWRVTLCNWVRGFQNFKGTVRSLKMTAVLPFYVVPGSIPPLSTTSQPRRPEFSETSLLYNLKSKMPQFVPVCIVRSVRVELVEHHIHDFVYQIALWNFFFPASWKLLSFAKMSQTCLQSSGVHSGVARNMAGAWNVVICTSLHLRNI